VVTETEVQYIQTQLVRLGEQIGLPLDFNIYYDGMPVAAVGHTLTEALVERLNRLDPRKIKFSREEAQIRLAEEEVEQLIETQLRGKAEQVALDAGVAEELSEEVRQMATRKVKEIFESCRYLTKLDLAATSDLAANLIRRASRLDTASFKLRDLRNYDEYTYFHSVNVTVLAVTLFRDYVKDENELLELGIGMLLHDIGKSKIDLKILNKPGRLTEDEFAIMSRHVVYGYNLVKNNTEVSPMAKGIILNHHERLNGSGYTRGLTEGQLSVFDMVAAICDVFDAVTTNRVYRVKMDVHRAVSILIRGAGSHFHTRIVNHFLKGIGRFPVGTFVLLSSGEIGVVSKVNSNAISLPVIRVIFDAGGAKLAEPGIVDLYTSSDVYIERPIDVSPVSAFSGKDLNPPD
jgi:HD-GYP domain-containing protein (c-di-GMP phosphodiesterase class II)